MVSNIRRPISGSSAAPRAFFRVKAVFLCALKHVLPRKRFHREKVGGQVGEEGLPSMAVFTRQSAFVKHHRYTAVRDARLCTTPSYS